MKKLVALFASALIMLSCEQSSVCVAPEPTMESYYKESLTLKSVEPDSVQRFAVKVNSYTAAHPAAKADPLYQEIMNNISSVLSVGITVPGWDVIYVNYQ